MSPTTTVRLRPWFIGLVLVLACSAVAGAEDTLTLHDGRTFTGRLVSDDGAVVVFEAHLRGMTITVRYPRSEVKALTHETAAEGPTYYALPIVGPIGHVDPEGTFVSADAFRKALGEVRQAKPDYVVLVIDSPGGSVAEMERIVGAIAEAPDLHFIAYVKHGLSAAAIIATACPRIYMAPGSVIGAAVPFTKAPDGTPKNIEEKFLSAERAMFRASARLGGHSPLIVLGMMDTDLELDVITQGGRPVVVEAGSCVAGVPLKRRGRILTLTADEALACGLSAGTADSLDAIASHLGLPGWRPVDDRAWHRMVNAAEAEQWREDQRRIHSAKLAAWSATVDQIRKEMGTAEQMLVQARSRRVAAEQAAFALQQQMNAELGAVRADWDAARTSSPGLYRDVQEQIADRARVSQAEYDYHTRGRAIEAQFGPQIAAARAAAQTARDEEVILLQRLTSLGNQIPDQPRP